MNALNAYDVVEAPDRDAFSQEYAEILNVCGSPSVADVQETLAHAVCGEPPSSARLHALWGFMRAAIDRRVPLNWFGSMMPRPPHPVMQGLRLTPEQSEKAAWAAEYMNAWVASGRPGQTDIEETFLAALEGLGSYRQRGLPFRSWLYRLASTRVNRLVRRRPLAAHTSFEEEPHDPRAEREPEEVSHARRALLSLPVRYQSALSLHYMDGLSLAEVAAALGCRLGTIKARLSRGRELLRARLAAQEAKELR